VNTRYKLILAAAVAVTAVAVGVFSGRAVWERAPRATQDRAEPWRLFPAWQGTKVGANFSVPGEISEAFAADPPTPDGRRTEFAFCLEPGSRFYPCQGWYGLIDSVVPNASGWEVNVTIRANTGVVFTNGQTKETWQVSKGVARCIACEGLGQPFAILMRD